MSASKESLEVSTSRLRDELPEVLEKVAAGHALVVTHYRRPVAELVPVGTLRRVRQQERTMKKPMVMVFYNQAGGSCKTSLSRDLAYDMVQRGLKVLAVDADPQGSLTRWLGGYEVMNDRGTPVALQPERSVADVIEGRATQLPEPLKLHGIDLLPSNGQLEGVAVMLALHPERMTNFAEVLRMDTSYDVVIIDTPPADNLLVKTCLVASDLVFMPVPSSKGLDRVDTVTRAIAGAQAYHPDLRFGGFILCSHTAAQLHDREVAALLREEYSVLGPVSTPITHRRALFNDAAAEMMPVAAYRPRSEAVAEIQAVTDELLSWAGYSPVPAVVMQ